MLTTRMECRTFKFFPLVMSFLCSDDDSIVLKLGSDRSDHELVGRPVRANIWIGHAVNSTGTGKNR